jgi:hypothetical protein
LLLPFLNQKDLYNRIDLSKPWDSPENAAVFKNQKWMTCPSVEVPDSNTNYLAIVTDSSCLRAGRSLAQDDISDGISIGVIEVPADESVPWMEPRDADEALVLGFVSQKNAPHANGRFILLMDGSLRFLAHTTPANTVKAMLTAAGGEPVDGF